MSEKRRVKNEQIPSVILTEYEKSQDSAEHHNQMIWILTPILLGFSLWVLEKLFSQKENQAIQLILAGFGLFSLIYFSTLIERANYVKNLKYNICKKIEKDYHFYFKQHTETDNKSISRNFPKYRLNILRTGIYLTFVIYFVWSIIYLFSLCDIYPKTLIWYILFIGTSCMMLSSIIGIIIQIIYSRVN